MFRVDIFASALCALFWCVCMWWFYFVYFYLFIYSISLSSTPLSLRENSISSSFTDQLILSVCSVHVSKCLRVITIHNARYLLSIHITIPRMVEERSCLPDSRSMAFGKRKRYSSCCHSPSPPSHFAICREGEVSEKSGWRKERKTDEIDSQNWGDLHALIHQELCIKTCQQALGIPLVLVCALNSTDVAVQSDISKDYTRCFLINMYFVFCHVHVKFCVKWQLRSQYILSLSFLSLLPYFVVLMLLSWRCIEILVIAVSGLDPLSNASHQNTCYQETYLRQWIHWWLQTYSLLRSWCWTKWIPVLIILWTGHKMKTFTSIWEAQKQIEFLLACFYSCHNLLVFRSMEIKESYLSFICLSSTPLIRVCLLLSHLLVVNHIY